MNCLHDVYAPCAYLGPSEEGIGFPGAGVMDSCELPCGCWKPNLNPLQEPQVVPLSHLSCTIYNNNLFFF